jgi:hypothetical protein
MGSVLFNCSCGKHSFLCSTDNRSYCAYLIPDQGVWEEFWTAIDDAVEKSGPSAREKESACMELRQSHYRRQRAWQCPVCGSLYIEDGGGNRSRFVPESPEIPRRLLAGKSSS